MGSAGLKRVVERVSSTRRKITEDLQPVTAGRKLRAQIGDHVELGIGSPASRIGGQDIAGGVQQVERGGEISADRARRDQPGFRGGEIVVVVIRLIAAAGDGDKTAVCRDGSRIAIRIGQRFSRAAGLTVRGRVGVDDLKRAAAAVGRDSGRPSAERTATRGVKSWLLTVAVNVPAPSVIKVYAS